MIKTYTDFITQIEGVYGVYNPALKAELAVYLPAKVKQEDLQSLYWKIREEYTTAYKTPPDLTQINALFKQSDSQVEIEAAQFYDMLNNTGCSLDNIMVSDIRAQKALVSAFGSWPDFCQRNPESEQWHRKNFIAAFVKHSHETADEQPSIMYGESNQRMQKLPIFYGDKEKCQMLIEQQQKPLQIDTSFIKRVI